MNLRDRYRDSETVFIGRIVAIDPPPTSASGVVVVFRDVIYAVIGTLKGRRQVTPVKVAHYVVDEARDMLPSDTRDPATPFRRGAVHLVFAVEGEDVFGPGRSRLEEIDSDDGVVELSDSLVGGLRRALSPRRSLFAVLRWLFFGR